MEQGESEGNSAGDPRLSLRLNALYATASDPEVRDPVRAIELAEKCVAATHARDPAILDTLAEAYFAAGDTARAVETIRKAIGLEPDEPHYRQQLDRFLAD